MSEYSSIVPRDRRFDQVKLFNLNEEQFDCMKFSAPKNVDYLTCIAIDQSEDLLLRFIQPTGDEHVVQSTDNALGVVNSSSFNSNRNSSSSNSSSNNNNNNNGSDVQIEEETTIDYDETTKSHHQNGCSGDPALEKLMIDQQERIVYEINVFRNTEIFSFCKNSFVINDDSRQSSIALVQLKDRRDHIRFNNIIQEYKRQHQQSTFRQRTDFASASQYFQFYGYLSQQQNMMQDYIRTSTYQKAIHSNSEDFKDKVILDVGAGSGILSFFALQAGAKKIYAVEASSMAKHAQMLVQSNGIGGRIEVIAGKIEEVDLPEPVDIIISEPMGYMLFNERMLETYLHAKKWLRSKEEGRMFPSRGDLHIAPFTDAQLYIEQTNKANFWFSKDFHGIDLRALHSAATDEYFKQPIVDTFDARICMAKTVRHIIDFQTAHETDLHCINIPLEYVANQTGHIHGLAFWFDVAFIGSNQTVWLSTAPSQPLTHWYQVRCLLTTPLFVNKGQNIYGNCILKANKRQSYDVDIELYVKELGTRSSNTLDLKNPYFRYTGQPTPAPPGTTEISPSEQLWSTTVYDPYQPVVNPTIIQSNPQQLNNTISQQALQQMQAIATSHPGYPGQIRLLTSNTQPCNNNQVSMNDFNGVQ